MPFIAASIDTFSMLNVLGLAAAVLVIGVLVVYLQARQRARTVSNVLSMRMGMRDGQARAALVLELAAMLLAAFVLGAIDGDGRAAASSRRSSTRCRRSRRLRCSSLRSPRPCGPSWASPSCRWPAGGSSIGGPPAIDLGEVLRVAE